MTRSASKPAQPSDAPGVVALSGLAGHRVQAQVQTLGSGSPIVFLHGLVGLNDHWEDVVARIRHQHECTLLELPLLNLKDDDCSIHGATALTIDFLQQRFPASAFLVGNSFGGHVALNIALQQPSLVRGLILAGASGILEKSMVSDIQLRPSRSWLERKIAELFYDRAKMQPNDVDRAFRELSERSGARAMVKLSRSARRNHLGDKIHNIQAPTLLIWGRQDVVTPPEAAEQFHDKISDSRLVWLDQCGHAPMIECPDAFAHAVLDFTQDLARRGA